MLLQRSPSEIQTAFSLMPSPAGIAKRRSCQPNNGDHADEYDTACQEDFIRTNNKALLGNGAIYRSQGLLFAQAIGHHALNRLVAD